MKWLALITSIIIMIPPSKQLGWRSCATHRDCQRTRAILLTARNWAGPLCPRASAACRAVFGGAGWRTQFATDPYAYIDSNLTGFTNILEGCRQHAVEHLVYASSSSVYGANTKLPFSVDDEDDHPVSFYGVTKKANELMAHAYSHLYRLPTTGLRFFTVYGPWGRPDMAPFLFTSAILAGRPIDIYNYGKNAVGFHLHR